MRILLLIILLSGCAHEIKENPRPKIITTKLCIVNSITYQTTCGEAVVDIKSIYDLAEDEVVIILNKSGQLFVTTYK
jgi:peptidyl-tRNA hydrolase